LLGQNGQAAQRHFDAVVSQHLPAYFFAGIRDSKDKKHSYLAKCELDYDVLRIIHLADYEPNHKEYEGPSKAAGEDQLGNLMTSIPGGPGEFEGITLKCFWQVGLAHFGGLIWPTPRDVKVERTEFRSAGA
jgi:hypothetical protein